MKLQDIIQTIEENQSKIAVYGKFDDVVLKKINYKLRLDWNYYSNRMEGGTLTREETRSVMVGNIDVKGKPFRDVAEMTGHDKVVLEVLLMSKGELKISEKRMKEIHRAIMYEEDTVKKKLIGEWKTKANEIINYKGEKILFTQPIDVPDAVHKLIDKTNSELEKKQKHALQIAAQFHIDLVSIHPFYDGNGRTTRILTNVILLACGYPAIIIKDEHKNAYYQLLGDIQAYGGNADLFYAFIGERIIDTQKIVLDALAGKVIEEGDDVDKEIILFKNSLSKKNESNKQKTQEQIKLILQESGVLLFDRLKNTLSQFDELFHKAEKSYNFSRDDYHNYDVKKRSGGFTTTNVNMDFLNWVDKQFMGDIFKFGINIYWEGYKRSLPAFDIGVYVFFDFKPYSYSIIINSTFDVPKCYIEQTYDFQLTKEEINYTVKEVSIAVMKFIKDNHNNV